MTRNRRLTLAVILPLLAAVVCLLAARGPTPPGRLIRAGERLRISVVGLMGEGVETRLLRRVAEDGTIRLPKIDADDLDAAGMTADDLERDLERRYEQQTTAKSVFVVVSRMDLGEDHALTPGQSDLEGDPTATPLERRPAVLRRVLTGPLELRDVPAEIALARLGAAYKLPLIVRWESMEQVGVDRRTAASLSLPAGTRADEALSLLLDRIGGGFAELRWTYWEQAVVVGDKQKLREYVNTYVFDLRPLLEADALPEGAGREETVQRVIDLVTATVESDEWQYNGGEIGKIAELNGRLVVTGTPEMLRGVAALLETLRGQ